MGQMLSVDNGIVVKTFSILAWGPGVRRIISILLSRVLLNPEPKATTRKANPCGVFNPLTDRFMLAFEVDGPGTVYKGVPVHRLLISPHFLF